MSPSEDDPLSVTDVLRYWLAMIRHEEALRLKVRAVPPIPSGTIRIPNLTDPQRGQSYFKLRCGGAEAAERFLLTPDKPGQGTLLLSLDGDRGAFFEHWLRSAYLARRYFGQDVPPSFVAGFPVLYHAKRGELSVLLQLPLRDIRWCDEKGEAWKVPSEEERLSGTKRAPPSDMALVADVDQAERELPYAVDELVLTRILGVQEELVGEFTKMLEDGSSSGALTPVKMVQSVMALLKQKDMDGQEDSWNKAILEALRDVPTKGATDTVLTQPLTMMKELASLVESRVVDGNWQTWPLAIVYDGAVQAATKYLQEDLKELIRKEGVPPLPPYQAYMTGERLPVGRRAHVGLRPGHAPTSSQRDAAERFLGSDLTVVQGPPGTGKTELIVGLCIQTLVERMSACGSGTPPFAPSLPFLVVTSTNNRAVDNALSPLGENLPRDRLPVALRVGSRIVVASLTVPQLRQSLEWLRAAVPREETYEVARNRLRTLIRPIQQADREWQLFFDRAREREQLEMHCQALRVSLDSALRAGQSAGCSPATLVEARRAFAIAERKMDLQKKALGAKGEPGRTLMHAVRTLHTSFSKKLAPALVPVLPSDATDPRTSLPQLSGSLPEEDSPKELWKEAFDQLEDYLIEVENLLGEQEERMAAQVQPQLIHAQLEAAEKKVSELEEKSTSRSLAWKHLQEQCEAKGEELFTLATEVREAWAGLHKDRLVGSLQSAVEFLEGVPSPRALLRSKPKVFEDLVSLFPVMGCTLLSIGNLVPLKRGCLDRVVIDEAGQCHPAYAVSGLARARQALIIGDVHQLEAVIELGRQEEARVLRRLGLGHAIEALEPFRVHSSAAASTQALAARSVTDVPSLREHFRCQPPIIEISNRLCSYDLKVCTPPQSLQSTCSLLRGPLLGIDVQGHQTSYLGSWRNDDEVRIVVRLVGHLVRSGVEPHRIAVLTPYRGQLRMLEQGLEEAGFAIEQPGNSKGLVPSGSELEAELWTPEPGLALGTLHRFQGGERDVVVLSMVVSQLRSLGFTNTRVNLVNVAVSRARLHLIVVGNPSVLSRGRITGELVRSIPEDGWLKTRG